MLKICTWLLTKKNNPDKVKMQPQLQITTLIQIRT